MSQPVSCTYSLRAPLRARERRDPPMSLREIQDGRDAVHAPARFGLSILAAGYTLAVRTRTALFDRGWKGVRQRSVPVVSVGNLTAGGTGKTPFVAWLAERALRAGRRPGVLSRGYGPRPAGALSDEGALLDELLGPSGPAGRGPRPRARRRAPARGAPRRRTSSCSTTASSTGGSRRDVDVVLLDATNPFGFGRLLPRGLLREPAAALARAHAVVVTRAERVDADAVARPCVREVAARGARAALATSRARARGRW